MTDIAMRFGRDMLVVEGGIGMMLERYGIEDEGHPEMLNLTEPAVVEEIHRYHILAGAHCALSNTRGATPDRLRAIGADGDAETLCREGVRLAKAGRPQHVLAAIGPSTVRAGDDDGARYDEAFALYRGQASALASEEPDAILLMTFGHLQDALCALRASKEAADLPVIVSCAFDAQGRMVDSGHEAAMVAEVLGAAGTDAVGANCHLGPREMPDVAARLVSTSAVPVLAMPDVEGRHVQRRWGLDFEGSPDEMAQAALRLREIGVQLIGTCCGSTPAYTGAIYAAVGTSAVMK